MGPHPAVAAIRLAVRRALHEILSEVPSEAPRDLPVPVTTGGPPAGAPDAAPPPPEADPVAAPGATAARSSPSRGPARSSSAPGSPADRRPLVLVACSGGADSMALASALAFEAARLEVRAGAVTVDHQLQPGSDLRALDVADRLTALGLAPIEAVTVAVGRGAGPEAAAREARYAALDEVADRLGAAAVLLGHTRDDQAETVLLGLARGSGTRSLSGMAAVSGSLTGLPGAERRYRRPFLTVDRQTTRKACMVQSLPVWDDPHNADPAYTRSRVRHEAMPTLEKALGKGVIEALARTAQLSRDDADALDAWAAEAMRTVRIPEPATEDGQGQPARPRHVLDVARLHALPPAVRRRVLRRAAISAGAPAGSLFARHIEETDRLITAWRGQRAINLPGRVEALRRGGTLVIRQSDI
ncbi:tRNA lysidine(34) synthetase TilS [Streptomyces sp. 549]|uniref:tRNA lysidine(34) synthetase TilS n=1 Tax=Streptomyces sp. 549 TaxID=3049076 RepID=UPI0024C2ADD4|nr:tRNA lysidine(34) synthetase TilS [Streptomyces sp. 549]MDK1472305.1 tRNA lysidine(34) synthetase TilS [Streptomyces sp. 549]